MILKNIKKAFSLLEVMMGVTIFTITIVGVFNINQVIKSSMISTEDKVTALYLSQEGFEYMRNLRDSYVSKSFNKETGWNEFLKEIGFDVNKQDQEEKRKKIETDKFGLFVLKDSELKFSPVSIDDVCDKDDKCKIEKISILGQKEFKQENRTNKTYYREISIIKEKDETNIINIKISIYWEDKGELKQFSMKSKLGNIVIF